MADGRAGAAAAEEADDEVESERACDAASSSSSSSSSATATSFPAPAWPCCRALRVLAEQCLERSPERRPAAPELVRSLGALADTLRRSAAGAEVDYLFAALRRSPASPSSPAAHQRDDVVASIAAGAGARAKGGAGGAPATWALGGSAAW